MTTQIIHIRNSTSSNNEIYIGRPGKKAPNARWGNPIVIGKNCMICENIHISGGETLPCYEIYLINKLSDLTFRTEFLKLKDMCLVCFCRPENGFGESIICHGQIMVKYLDS